MVQPPPRRDSSRLASPRLHLASAGLDGNKRSRHSGDSATQLDASVELEQKPSLLSLSSGPGVAATMSHSPHSSASMSTQSSLRDSSGSMAPVAMAAGHSPSPSMLSDTGAFEVRYNDGPSGSSSVAPTPMAAAIMSPRQQMMQQQQQQEQQHQQEMERTQISAAASPASHAAEHTSDVPESQQARHAFSFARATHSSSPSAASDMSASTIPTPSSSASGETALSSTAKFTPSPSVSPAPTPMSALRSPEHSESPQLSPTPQTQSQQQQQQQRTPPHPPAAVATAHRDDDDPFRQLSTEAVQMQHQQQQLLRNSTSLSLSRNNSSSLARTVVAPTRTPTKPTQQQQWHEEEKQQLVHTPSSFAQTTPRTPQTASPAATAAALSSLSARALRQKVAQIERLISDFDAKFLERDGSNGGAAGNGAGAGAGGRYPAWALPFVEEMAAKLDAVLSAQHRAEEKEEREAAAAASAAPRDGALHLGDLAASRGRGSVRFDALSTEQRALQREEEARGSAQRVADIAALKAAAQRSPAQSRPAAGGRFFPDDVYTVELNDELPFLRGHGSFSSRRAAASTRHASPRRNLRAGNAGPGAESSVPYQQRSPQPSQQAPLQQQQQHGRERGRSRPVSASSAHYLTGLLGRDVGASTLNRLFRSTERSPSPPAAAGRARSLSPGGTHTKDLPGPTIPKAPRFASTYTAAPGQHPSPRQKKPEGQRSRREREIQLEMEALKLRVDELMHSLVLQDRARDDAFAAALHQQQQQQRAPLSPPRRFQLNQSSSTTSLHHTFPQQEEQEGGVDESELASALVRIGEANRAKFMALLQQITAMQQGMLQQQERIDQMASARGNDEGSAAAAAAAAAALEEQRAAQARLQGELEELQRSLAATLTEKEKLAAQVRDLRSHAERSKFDLMEKVSLLSSSRSEQGRASQQDKALLRGYEEDLRASREAIAALQGMVAREAEHARAFRADKEALQCRLDQLSSTLAARERDDRLSAHAAGRASLRPAEKFKSLMHKYMAAFYRTQFQALLSERGSGAAQAARVEAELVRSREKHELELVYQQRAHQAVLHQVNVSMQRREEAAEELVERLESTQDALHRAENLAAQKEQDLIASTLLNEQLASERSARAAESRDNAFADLVAASFRGDYLRLRNDTRILRVVYGLGDEEILFSDFVQRIDRRNKYQKRILLITDHHILCLWADRGRPLRRSIPIASLRYVSLSRQSADLLVLHVQDAYDYLLISNKRTEIMFHLLQLTSKISGGTKTLAYKYGERVYVSDRDRKHRDVQVHEDGITLGEGSFRPHHAPQDEAEIREMQQQTQTQQQPRISDS